MTSHSTIKSPVGYLAAVAALFFLLGCTPKKPTTKSNANESTKHQSFANETLEHNPNDTSERQAVVPGTQMPHEPDDSRFSGWKTEAISAKIDQQLKRLGMLIRQRDLQKATSIATADGKFQTVRPDSSQVFQNDLISVLRRNGTVESATSDFPSAFGSLFAEQAKTVKEHIKFKIFEIQLHSDYASIGVYFQRFVQFKDRSRQVNATWKCDWKNLDTDSPLIDSLQVDDYEEILLSAPPLFSDCTEAVVGGPVFDQQFRMGTDYWLKRIPSNLGIDIGGWQGLAIGDINGDYLDDVYVCAPGGLPNRLFLQRQDGTTQEIAATAGVDWLESSHGALIIDIDNDADQDLVVGVASGLLIMSNDGRGSFELRASQVLPAALPYSISAADYDNDGDLDLFVCCYNRRRGVNQHLLFARPIPYHDANNGGRNVLLRNDSTPAVGAWRFRYATGISGMDHNNRRFSYASAWEDFDDDGDQDLYVANDFGRNNLYRNDHGTFTDIAPQSNVLDIGPGMSTCWGDANNDGKMDLYVSNMFSSAGNRITGQSRFQQDSDEVTKTAFRRHARGNSLFLNQADGTFRDVSIKAGVVLGRWAWGSKFVDLNNDGWQDLIVANGFITQEDTGDL